MIPVIRWIVPECEEAIRKFIKNGGLADFAENGQNPIADMILNVINNGNIEAVGLSNTQAAGPAPAPTPNPIP